MKHQKNPSVFVVILNYNGKDKLDACLSSVFRSDWKDLEVVVVDNGSQDSSFDEARSKFPRAHFIKSPENLGFSKGNNLGLRFALEKFADYVLVLNNDTLIEKTTVSTLVQAIQDDPCIGIVSPLIFGANGKDIWFAGGKIDWSKMKTRHICRTGSADPYPTEYVSGCAMLVSKKVFKKIGLFDERFFLYYEDADFSIRAARKGFGLCIVPAAHMVHLEQSNTDNSSKIYWLVLSALIFFRLHADPFRRCWLSFYFPLRRMKNIFDLIFRKNEQAKETRRAYEAFKKISF